MRISDWSSDVCSSDLTDPDLPLQPPAGRSGRPETARQSYSIDAVNEFDPILDLMYDFCDAMELDVDTLSHESGAAQLEINFEHDDEIGRASCRERGCREV